MTNEGKILIVDDVLSNISVLFEFLSLHQYEVLIAQDGESALEVVDNEHPELILLDVMMPGIDGFEVCRRLKENPATQDIPVIFMTALTHTAEKVRGFELGAVDYVTKPVQQEELLARVNAHLTIVRLQHELALRNEELSHRNEELDAFAHTVAHDLKNPANGIVGFGNLILQSYRDCLGEEGVEDLQFIIQSGHKMVTIVDSLLLLAGTSRHQQLSIEPVDMGAVIAQVKQRLLPALEAAQPELQEPESWPRAYGYAPWLEEIWSNYLSNGLKYGGEPLRLTLGATEAGEQVKFWIEDQGEGLSVEQQAQLFQPFTRLHSGQSEGHGLGLVIVRRIAERLGGKAGVESEPGKGSRFYFTLPCKHPEALESPSD